MNEPRHPVVNEVASSLQKVFAPEGLNVLPVFADDNPWEPTIVEPARVQGCINLMTTLDKALPYFGTVYVFAVGSSGGRRTCDGLVLIGRGIAFTSIAVGPGWLYGDRQVVVKHVGRDSRAAAQTSAARSGAGTMRRLGSCPRVRGTCLDPVRKLFTHGLRMR